MGQSLSQLYVHLTFATKERIPIIQDDWNAKLHAYMDGILKNFDSPALIINSVPDHVHILFRMSKNYALAKIVEEVKKNATKWVKLSYPEMQHFKWQVGYGAFSVSSSAIDKVKRYIERQKEHHNVLDYRSEIEEFVKQYDIIEYDERYFWE